MAAMRACAEVGCPNLVLRGRCPDCAPAHEADRQKRWPWRWVYRDRRWPKTRWRAFVRAGFRCEAVENGVRCPVTDPTGARLHGHHNYPGGVAGMLADGLDPFDDRFVVCACGTHHQRFELAERARDAPVRRRAGR